MIKEMKYSKFSSRLHDTAAQNNIPLDGIIGLTAHCNLHCRHCYIRDNSVTGELTTREIFGIVDQITEAGCVYLLLTGGEPLLRPDFEEIYIYARKKGLIVTLFTNGTLIDEETTMVLKEYTPFSIEITLYGATPETYDRFTGVRGSYDSCMNGIVTLLKHNLPLSLKTMITTLNKHELDGMKAIAESLGLDFKYGLPILPHISGSLSTYKVRLSPAELLELDFQDHNRLREWSTLYEKFNAPASKDRLFNCGAGQNCFNITSQGRLRICDMIPEPDYCLKTNRFIDGYRMFGPIMARKLKGVKNCGGCAHVTFCDSCPGISLLEGDKDGERPVDYHCEIAHKRVEYLREVTAHAKEKAIQEA